MSTLMQQQVYCNVTAAFVTFDATLSNLELKLKRLGEWVKLHREKMKFSQETAAEKAGLSRYQWMRIENGQSGTKRETILNIAKELNANENEALSLLAGLEPQNTNKDSHEIYDGVQIVFTDEAKFSEEQKKAIRDGAATFTRGVAVDTSFDMNLVFSVDLKPEVGKTDDINGKELAPHSKNKIPIKKNVEKPVKKRA